jgi:hypothetical protein
MKKRAIMNKKEQVLEGYHAMGRKASYNDAIPQVKIVLQHTRQIEEGEQRFRNIAKIFVENLEGERFLLPTNRPGLARVYARHIAEGGTPYDDKGRHITTLVEEYQKMAGFVRATRNGQFNESALALVNEGLKHYNDLRMTLQGMASHRGYNNYFESYTPVLNEESEDDTSLNELFVQETLDPRIESVMPILKRLSKNINEMSAVKELEEWAQAITEVEDETTKTLAEPAEEMLDEAPGAETLAHDDETEKSNLKAFDLDEGFSPSSEVADQIVDSLGGEEGYTSDDIYRAVEEYQSMMDNPEELDVEEVVQIVMDKMDVSEIDEAFRYYYPGATKSDIKKKVKKFKHGVTGFEEDVSVNEGIVGNMINKAKGMFNKPATAPAAPAKAAPVVPDAATKARIAAAPQGYDPNTGKPQVAAKAAPGAVAKGGTMDMTKKVVAPAAKPAVVPQGDYSPQELAEINKDIAAMDARTLAQVAAKTDLDPTVTAAVKAEVARRKGVAEDLDANQKRVGQLGPTEKVGPKGAVGKLVGTSESREFEDIKRLAGLK